METLIYSVYKNIFDSIIYRNAEGKYHRIDGPAFEGCNGYKSWWVDGKRHRSDGPAIEDIDGSKEWWVNDELHRIDGPAIEWPDGSKSWWINGIQLTEKEFLIRTTVQETIVQEFSMDEIAKRLGIPVELLKIKK